MDYLEVVRSLPTPTSEQRDAFIQHIAAAENWLKTVPFESGAAILAYLDPHAGARINAAPARDRFTVEVLADDDELLHASEMPTARHRELHGAVSYWTDLGAGTAAVDGDMLRRARLPQAGIVADGVLLPVPATLAALACRPGALLHATFAGAHDPGGWRRFRFAVERIPKLEGAPAGHPLVRDIDAWRTSCRGEDDAAFSTWLRAEHDEHAPALSEAERWQRYIVWRDSDACTAMHLDQDRRFRQSDIPERVVRAHHDALHAVRTMLDAVVEATRAAC